MQQTPPRAQMKQHNQTIGWYSLRLIGLSPEEKELDHLVWCTIDWYSMVNQKNICDYIKQFFLTHAALLNVLQKHFYIFDWCF